MRILSADDVRAALPMPAAIQAMKRAYAALSDGQAQVPLRTRLTVAAYEAQSLFMPAYVRAGEGSGNEALAVKVVSLYPRNPGRGLAYIQAAVLLMEPDTGRALALLEGGTLTAIRTGAASGAAIELLARQDSRVLAVIGAGTQGRTQLEAACTARPVTRALIYDPDRGKAEALVEELRGRSPYPADMQATGSAAGAVREADVICTATTSRTPVFDDRDIRPGTHISAVGAYTPDMQEIPAETVRRARVIVDSRAACLEEAGDIIQPLRAGLFDESHIQAELGEVVLGRKPGRTSPEQVTYFKSVGIAVQDAMAAQAAWENARELGLGQEVDF